MGTLLGPVLVLLDVYVYGVLNLLFSYSTVEIIRFIYFLTNQPCDPPLTAKHLSDSDVTQLNSKQSPLVSDYCWSLELHVNVNLDQPVVIRWSIYFVSSIQ